MCKFKRGDVVRVYGNCDTNVVDEIRHGFKIGDVVEVVKTQGFGETFLVKCLGVKNGVGYTQWVPEKHLEHLNTENHAEVFSNGQ